MKRSIATLGAIACSLFAYNSSAFNTGNHFTATQEGLARAGFSPGAIAMAKIANYEVDLVVNLPDKALRGPLKGLKVAKTMTRYFHFDGLWGPAEIERELGWLHAAARTVVKKAANDPTARNVRRIVHVLGIVLHAVQDFYSHSNFADVDWRRLTGRPIVTIDDLPRHLWAEFSPRSRFATATRAEAGIFSGSASTKPYGQPPARFGGAFPGHGGAKTCDSGMGHRDCGMNHDSVVRRGHLTALLMAIEATYRTAKKFEEWVGAAVWKRVKSVEYAASGPCLRRAQIMSSAVGQWGYPGDESTWKLLGALADQAVHAEWCNVLWEVQWGKDLGQLFRAAPPVKLAGTDAPAFELPREAAVSASRFGGTYRLTLGDAAGSLTLAETGGKLTGSLTLGGKTYSLSAAVSGSALSLRASATGENEIIATLYLTGTSALAGVGGRAGGPPDACYAERAR